jgi:3-mercaptopyruvate sulfurtransferase SseA
VRTATALALWLVVLTGCQIAPKTKVGESRRRDFVRVTEKSAKPLVISEMTVVLDTRSSFDYGLNHVLNSHRLPWSALAEQEASGEVLRDKHRAAVRLALLGITPQTPVVVVGYGSAMGQGEEGRLAWNLLYLGFQDVQVTGVEPLRRQMTPNPTPAPQNVSPAKLDVRDDLQIGRDEFINLVAQPKLRLEKRIHIIDVRSEKEYVNKVHSLPGKGPLPDINAINIEWKQFYGPDGRPDLRFKDKLGALSILPKDRVIVISNRGVRSGAAAYALLAMGFERVQNFTGGWKSLMR